MDEIYQMIDSIDKTIGTTGWARLVVSRVPNPEEELTIRVLLASKDMTLDSITKGLKGYDLLIYSNESKDDLLMLVAEPYMNFNN